MLREDIHKITTTDDYIISLHVFSPSDREEGSANCDGVVLAVHGLGEHMDRYRHLAEFTCKKNKIFAAFNIRGHGNDAAIRGDVQNFSSLVLDIILVFRTLKKLYPHIHQDSFVLFGHSFGGLQVTHAAAFLRHEVKKIFLCAPGFAPKIKVPAWKTILINSLYRLFPKLYIPLGSFSDKLSNNLDNNAQYKKDTIVLRYVSARFGKIIIDAFIEENVKPVIKNTIAEATIILPSDDKIIDSKFTKEISNLFQTPAKVLEIEGAGHEAFNEVENIQKLAFSHYEKWLEKI